MVYAILKWVARLTLKVFYQKVEVLGRANLPDRGPLIVLSNHPSTFMDPIILGCLARQPLHFLAKSSVFGSPVKDWIFTNVFNMVPVYRAQDNADLSKNEEAFVKCHEVLAQGGTLLIFPEGVSLKGKQLQKIKTGAARIALGAEASGTLPSPVQMVCIGLHYHEDATFQTQVTVNVDKPFQVAHLLESYAGNPAQTVHEVTETIRKRLEKRLVLLQDDREEGMLLQLKALFKGEIRGLAKQQGVSFFAEKEMARVLTLHKQKDPVDFARVSLALNGYMHALERLRLHDDFFAKSGRNMGSGLVLAALGFLFGVVPYLYGVVNNYLPYKIPGWIARAISAHHEYYPPIAMVAGMLVFPLFYTGQVWLCWYFTQQPLLTVLYATSLPVTGIFAYYFWYFLRKLQSTARLLALMVTRRSLLHRLQAQRDGLIDMLSTLRKTYTNAI
jgi:1-acyl-sn-glycerol-3-phosphate acyltransferase